MARKRGRGKKGSKLRSPMAGTVIHGRGKKKR